MLRAAILSSFAFLAGGNCQAQFDSVPQTRLVPIQTQASFDNKQAVAERWQLTKPAKHHNAIVKVSVASGAGTGSCIATTGRGTFVLTNHHVVSLGWTGNGFATSTHLRATIKSVTGDTYSAQVIYANPHYDIAVCRIAGVTNINALPLSEVNAGLGTTIEIAGYGGPNGEIRHFCGTAIQSREPLSINASVVSGDSGSPMLCNGHVVGVVYGAPNAAGNAGTLQGWAMTSPASSKINATTLCQVFRQICKPYGCEPIIRNPASPITQPISQPNNPIVDTEIKPIPGPPGPAGPPGKNAEIDYDKLAEEVIKRLPPFYPQWIGPNNEVIDEIKDGVRLGQTLPLRVEMITDAKTKSE